MNITLIGMSGAGKSTVGAVLAEKLGWAFVDTDTLYEEKIGGKNLTEHLAEVGEDMFLEEEEKAVLSFTPKENTVIATGGSVPWSNKAMAYLRGISSVVYLTVPRDKLHERFLKNNKSVLWRNAKTFDELCDMRHDLYNGYKDFIVKNSKSAEATSEEIKSIFGL